MSTAVDRPDEFGDRYLQEVVGVAVDIGMLDSSKFLYVHIQLRKYVKTLHSSKFLYLGYMAGSHFSLLAVVVDRRSTAYD